MRTVHAWCAALLCCGALVAASTDPSSSSLDAPAPSAGLPPLQKHFTPPSSIASLWKDWGSARVVEAGALCHEFEHLNDLGVVEATQPFQHQIAVLGLAVKDILGEQHLHRIALEKTPPVRISNLPKLLKMERNNKNASWCMPLTTVAGKVTLAEVLCAVGTLHDIHRFTEYNFVSNNAQHFATSILQAVQDLAGKPVDGVNGMKVQKFKLAKLPKPSKRLKEIQNFKIHMHKKLKKGRYIHFTSDRSVTTLYNRRLFRVKDYASTETTRLPGGSSELRSLIRSKECRSIRIFHRPKHSSSSSSSSAPSSTASAKSNP